MGSRSDLRVMGAAAEVLDELKVEYSLTIVSAHRTPERLFDFAKSARKNGIKVIIAGAGGAAHLPGMVASLTSLPVIGVPVATVALDGAKNAGILAAQILGTSDEKLALRLDNFKEALKEKVIADVENIDKNGWKELV